MKPSSSLTTTVMRVGVTPICRSLDTAVNTGRPEPLTTMSSLRCP